MNARPQGRPPASDDDLPPAPAIVRKKRKSSAEPEPKAARPAWFRYATWVVLLLLAVVGAIECRAQAYYRHNLHVAQQAIERVEGNTTTQRSKVTYDEIKDRMWSTPETSEGKSDFVPARIYTWSWHGLRKYVVRLYVDPKDGRLRDVRSEP
jgi:hypothetical protein